MLTLTWNGKSEDMCRWVIATYAEREDYKNNESVQQWLQLCRDWLEENCKETVMKN